MRRRKSKKIATNIYNLGHVKFSTFSLELNLILVTGKRELYWFASHTNMKTNRCRHAKK